MLDYINKGVLTFFNIFTLFMLCLLHAEGCETDLSKLNLKQDYAGNLLTVWKDYNPEMDTFSIFSAYQPLGGIWSTPATISSSYIHCIDPIVTVSSAGNVLCVWLAVDPNTSNKLLVFSTMPSIGGSWSAPALVSEPSETVINGWYSVTFDGQNLNCIWSSYITDPNTQVLTKVIRTSSAIFGGTWNTPQTLYTN